VENQLVHGVFAALLTPRFKNGKVDGQSFRKQLEFLRDKGVINFAVNGATSEFPSVSQDELKEMLTIAQSVTGGNSEYLCGVGAANLHDGIELAMIAKKGGAKGLLLPMPYFYPYAQDDLIAFCTAFAQESPLPILLYNLPQFTSGLEADTVLGLIKNQKNIIGIKDSSGSLNILRALTTSGLDCNRVIGSDGALAAALREGVADGVISGVSCVLPEVMKAMFEFTPGEAKFEHAVGLLNAFIAQLDVFPTPWGLKFASECRNITQASFPFPLSERRCAQRLNLDNWFEKWSKTAIESLS
jgi:4-hydroxy-tetrahydrodipicolinate synthase